MAAPISLVEQAVERVTERALPSRPPALDLTLPRDDPQAREPRRSGPCAACRSMLPDVPFAGMKGRKLMWTQDRLRGLCIPQISEVAPLEPAVDAGKQCSPHADWVDLLDRCAVQISERGFAAVPAPLPSTLLKAFEAYYLGLIDAGSMRLDTAYSKRFIAHRDPVAEWAQAMMEIALAPLLAGRYRRSYSFVCGYVGGAELPRHTDRPQCELTVSLCISATAAAERWPLFLENVAERTAFETRLSIGNALIFKGRELAHYRNALPAEAFFLSALFHFVPLDFDGSLD